MHIMAENRQNGTNNEQANWNIGNNRNRAVANHVPSQWNQENRFQESIFVGNLNQVQFPNYWYGMPLLQPMYPHNYLVYGNLSQAVLQPHLSQNYFRRNEGQRRSSSSSSDAVDSVGKLRYWEKVSNSSKSGFVFTVMSYNVLAQDLLIQHDHLYRNHDKESLGWKIRWNNIQTEIRKLQPDILCLQEVQNSHFHSHFSALEDLGYRGLFKQRTGVRSDGCAIYYKPSLMSLIEYATVEFKQPRVPMLDRDNVAIIAKFSPTRHSEKEFVVATTHLLYNPKRQDVRLAQTQLLLTELDRIAFDAGNYLPVIITGDLNATPDSVVYKLITEGKLEYENLSQKALLPGGAGPRMGKNFLPTLLRITDQCQHVVLLRKRQQNVCIPRSEELKLLDLQHSERAVAVDKKNGIKNDEKMFSSGTLTHNFSFKSVYKHQGNGDVEGTTFQDEWISVDYIFFSPSQTTENNLILLERYRLPRKRELGDIKIPNKCLGSDHLSLLAKFELN